MQIVLRDDPPWPDPADQLVFADNGAIGLDERHEHVGRAPAESQWSAVGENVAVLRQDLEPAKLEAGWRLGLTIHGRRLYLTFSDQFRSFWRRAPGSAPI